MKHATTEPLRLVIVRMPDSLHTWLKDHCEAQGVSMNQAVIDMVKRTKANEARREKEG